MDPFTARMLERARDRQRRVDERTGAPAAAAAAPARSPLRTGAVTNSERSAPRQTEKSASPRRPVAECRQDKENHPNALHESTRSRLKQLGSLYSTDGETDLDAYDVELTPRHSRPVEPEPEPPSRSLASSSSSSSSCGLRGRLAGLASQYQQLESEEMQGFTPSGSRTRLVYDFSDEAARSRSPSPPRVVSAVTKPPSPEKMAAAVPYRSSSPVRYSPPPRPQPAISTGAPYSAPAREWSPDRQGSPTRQHSPMRQGSPTRQSSPVRGRLVQERAAVFDRPASPPPPHVDPTELKLSDRRKLFEKGQAPKVIARFGTPVTPHMLRQHAASEGPAAARPRSVAEPPRPRPALEETRSRSPVRQAAAAPPVGPPSPSRGVGESTFQAHRKLWESMNNDWKQNEIAQSSRQQRDKELGFLTNRWQHKPAEMEQAAAVNARPMEEMAPPAAASGGIPVPPPPPPPPPASPPARRAVGDGSFSPSRQTAPARQSPSRQSPTRQSPTRQSPARQSPVRRSPSHYAEPAPPQPQQSSSGERGARGRLPYQVRVKPGCLYPSLSDLETASSSQTESEAEEGRSDSRVRNPALCRSLSSGEDWADARDQFPTECRRDQSFVTESRRDQNFATESRRDHGFATESRRDQSFVTESRRDHDFATESRRDHSSVWEESVSSSRDWSDARDRSVRPRSAAPSRRGPSPSPSGSRADHCQSQSQYGDCGCAGRQCDATPSCSQYRDCHRSPSRTPTRGCHDSHRCCCCSAAPSLSRSGVSAGRPASFCHAPRPRPDISDPSDPSSGRSGLSGGSGGEFESLVASCQRALAERLSDSFPSLELPSREPSDEPVAASTWLVTPSVTPPEDVTNEDATVAADDAETPPPPVAAAPRKQVTFCETSSSEESASSAQPLPPAPRAPRWPRWPLRAAPPPPAPSPLPTPPPPPPPPSLRCLSVSAAASHDASYVTARGDWSDALASSSDEASLTMFSALDRVGGDSDSDSGSGVGRRAVAAAMRAHGQVVRRALSTLSAGASRRRGGGGVRLQLTTACSLVRSASSPGSAAYRGGGGCDESTVSYASGYSDAESLGAEILAMARANQPPASLPTIDESSADSSSDMSGMAACAAIDDVLDDMDQDDEEPTPPKRTRKTPLRRCISQPTAFTIAAASGVTAFTIASASTPTTAFGALGASAASPSVAQLIRRFQRPPARPSAPHHHRRSAPCLAARAAAVRTSTPRRSVSGIPVPSADVTAVLSGDGGGPKDDGGPEEVMRAGGDVGSTETLTGAEAAPARPDLTFDLNDTASVPGLMFDLTDADVTGATPARRDLTSDQTGATPVPADLTFDQTGVTPARPNLTSHPTGVTPARRDLTFDPTDMTPARARPDLTSHPTGATPARPDLTSHPTGATPARPDLTSNPSDVTPVPPDLGAVSWTGRSPRCWDEPSDRGGDSDGGNSRPPGSRLRQYLFGAPSTDTGPRPQPDLTRPHEARSEGGCDAATELGDEDDAVETGLCEAEAEMVAEAGRGAGEGVLEASWAGPASGAGDITVSDIVSQLEAVCLRRGGGDGEAAACAPHPDHPAFGLTPHAGRRKQQRQDSGVFRTPMACVKSPEQDSSLPSVVLDGDGVELPLMHSVSFYRRQRPQEVPVTPVRQVVRNREVAPRYDDASSGSQDQRQMAASTQERIKQLQHEATQQMSVMSQASRALNLCNSTIEFTGSAEMVEAERLLLVATHRRQAALSEIQRLKTEGAMRQQGILRPASRGSLSVSSVTLPVKTSFVREVAAGAASYVYYFVVLLRYRGQVIATQMLSSEDSIKGNAINFPNLVSFRELEAEFCVALEVYGLQAQREVLPHDTKYHIRKDRTKTPKKLLKHQSSLTSPAVHSPAGPGAVRATCFQLMGFLHLTARNLVNNAWALEKVPSQSPLDGGVLMTVTCHADCAVEERGFITVFDDVSGFGAWHRRWAALSAGRLSFWKYPEDEGRAPPSSEVDLRRCVTERIGAVPRDICARQNTLLLVTVRQARPEDAGSLVMERRGALTRIRHLLSLDGKDERQLWADKLNETLANIRAWDPDAMQPHLDPSA